MTGMVRPPILTRAEAMEAAKRAGHLAREIDDATARLDRLAGELAAELDGLGPFLAGRSMPGWLRQALRAAFVRTGLGARLGIHSENPVPLAAAIVPLRREVIGDVGRQ